MTDRSTDPSAAGYRRDATAIGPAELPERTNELFESGFRLALVAGHDDGDALRAVYLFTRADPDRRTELHVRLDAEDPRLPSLAGLSFPAGRFEREMHDLFGIVPDDHPLPRRLVRHFHWPRGWHPMLNDAGEPDAFGAADGPYPFRAVEGRGVYEIPVGPVHAGMIEPGHFRFSVVGETILNLKARLWFVHKGIEKLFQGRRCVDGIVLAERISGDTAFGHSLAYCQAVEDALSVDVSVEVATLRGVLLELERLYNHVTDLGALCNDAGHSILNSHAGRIRERLLRINDSVVGDRLLRGALRIGGADLRRLPDLDDLADVGADVSALVGLALGHTVVRDRFAGTAVLTREQAVDLGALGYVARASGIATDARYDHPAIPESGEGAITRTGGDVLARFTIRAEEIADSIARITRLVEILRGRTGAGVDVSGDGSSGSSSGVGIVEGWRGTIVQRVEIAPDGTVTRLKIVDPSFFNWPALPVALADTIVPDFPLTNKSFNLSYAGNDL